MTSWRYKRILRLIKDLDDAEIELYNAIEKLLWRMHQICVEQGLKKKLSRKEKSQLYFSFRNSFVQAVDEDSIILTDLHHNYGDLIYGCVQEDGFPASWLWRKNWEKEFITEHVLPWKQERERIEQMAQQEEKELYERLKKKHGGILKPQKGT